MIRPCLFFIVEILAKMGGWLQPELIMGRRIPIWQIILVIAFMIGSLMYTLVVMKGYMHCALVAAGALAAIIAIINGYKWSYLLKGIINNITSCMQALLILFTVVMLIGTWIAGGVIQSMIYYGLMILKPSIFLPAVCLICAIVSIATGSSWTTAGTVGLAFIGIGQTLGIPVAMTGGAIISGAYFGDKMSPLSDTTNLAPAMAGATLFDHIKHMMWTVTPSMIIALILFSFLGMRFKSKSVNLQSIKVLQTVLKNNFYISPLLIIPAVLVIVMVVMKVPALPGLYGGVWLGAACAIIFQHDSIGHLVGFEMYEGFVSKTGNDFVDALLTRGGLSSMYYSGILMICAMVIAGVLDSSNMMNILCERVLKRTKGTGSLVATVLVSCIACNILCADQYVSIVLPGRMFKEEFENRHLKPKNLSRCLEDAGTVTSALVPWSTCGAYMSTTLGVATTAYAPYAFLNIINPLVSLFYGITGISMERMSDEEYNAIMEKRAKERTSSAE